MQKEMQLNTLLIFSNEYTETSDFSFSNELKNRGIHITTNPALNHEFRKILDPNRTLVVTDNEVGCNFAIQHNIPFILKWNENNLCFTQSTNSLKTTKPTCYYDDIQLLDYQYFLNQWKRSHHFPLTIAKTGRIELRELTMEDIPVLYQLRKNDSFSKTLPALDSLEVELEKHLHYIPYQYEFFDYGLWGIFISDSEPTHLPHNTPLKTKKEQCNAHPNTILIGQAGIENIEYQDETLLELSYLIHPHYQRQGYATESILAIYRYITESLELNKAIAIIAKNNLPSIKIAMNLGMKRKESVMHCGFDCNYYVIDNIHDFLVCYDSEQKRVRAAKSAFQKAVKKTVQSVYSRTWR